ncbi:MAG: 5-formyltetrahydrofolate cyclo-ligase [Clostridiales bacterium]
MDKKQWRDFCKLRLKNANMRELIVGDTLIISRLLALPEYRQAQCIFCYASKDREIDTFPILEHALRSEKIVSLPKVIGRGQMEARWIIDLNQLVPGAYGVKEPKAEQPVLTPNRIDVAVIPGLSCDVEGRRLGYGGGYYDRYLARSACFKVALCRERSLALKLPVDDYDILMDAVITERRTIYTGR